MRTLRLIPLLVFLGLALMRVAMRQSMAPMNEPHPARTYTPNFQQQYREPPIPQYRRPGDPLPPPPPDPANTQPFVPPMTDFKGTPAALGAPDMQAQIEKCYEDMDYAFLTRKAATMAAFYDDRVIDNGKPHTRADEQQAWQENFDEINDAERHLGVTLRVGSKTEIVKLTPKGPDRAAVQFKMTQRGFATIEGNSIQRVWIYKGRDLWVKKGDSWKIAESSSSGKAEEHAYVNNEEVDP